MIGGGGSHTCRYACAATSGKPSRILCALRYVFRARTCGAKGRRKTHRARA